MNILQDAWSYTAPILSFFGGVAVVVPLLVGAAYCLFKLFGEKWLQAKFDERLAVYKHEQQKELENLRFKIARLLDKATKFHQHEFEVLPETWANLSELYTRTVEFGFKYKTNPNLDDMSPGQLEDFISNCELMDWQKEEVRNSSDKTASYKKYIFWHRLAYIRELRQKCSLYILKHNIIMPNVIRDKTNELQRLILNALIQHEQNHCIGLHAQRFDDIDNLPRHGDALIDEIAEAIKKRLATLENVEF